MNVQKIAAMFSEVWRRKAEIERQLAYSVPSMATTSVRIAITQCFLIRHIAGLIAFAMNRRHSGAGHLFRFQRVIICCQRCSPPGK